MIQERLAQAQHHLPAAKAVVPGCALCPHPHPGVPHPVPIPVHKPSTIVDNLWTVG
jgi:hypothetical protein